MAQAATKILKLPRRKPTAAMREVEHCPVCGYPSATKQGARAHLTRSHGAGAIADRNWSIFYAYMEERSSVAELCVMFGVHASTIYRVIQRGISYPEIYELEEL